MPIAFFYGVGADNLSKNRCERIIEDWSQTANLSKELCTINVIPNTIQAGNAYKLMVKLYLPSLWSEEEVRHIQQSLSQSIHKNLGLEPEDLFVMTSIIQSGHVIDRGKLEVW